MGTSWGPIMLQPWLLALCLVCGLCTLPVPAVAETWQEKTSTHFRVSYQENSAFAAAVGRHVLQRCRRFYQRAL